MKCPSCGYEPKEQQPKFCSECGTRLLLPIQSTVNQATATATFTCGTNYQSQTNGNELQLTVVKSQEEENRNESGKSTNSEFELTTTSSLLPLTLENSNIGKNEEDNNTCKLPEEAVTNKNTKPTVAIVSCLPAQDGDGKTTLADEENINNNQEPSVTIHVDVPLQHEHTEDNIVEAEVTEYTMHSDHIVNRIIDSEILTTNSSNIKAESIKEEQASVNKNKDANLDGDKMDISNEAYVNNGTEGQPMDIKKPKTNSTSNLKFGSGTTKQVFENEGNNDGHVNEQTNIFNKSELQSNTEISNEHDSPKIMNKEISELENNGLSNHHKKDINSRHNQNRTNNEAISKTVPIPETQKKINITSKEAPDMGNENGRKKSNIESTEKKSTHKAKNKTLEQRHLTNRQQGDVKLEKIAEIKGNQEPVVRETYCSNNITLYFHVIVSKNFDLNPDEDRVVVKAGRIEGYEEWSDVLCEMTFLDINDIGFLYEGRTQISEDNIGMCIPYKYVIMKASGEEDYEYIHYVHGQDRSHINRCLYIQSKYIYTGEWHQYDDVCMKENHGLLKRFMSMWTDVYKGIAELKFAAGEVMLRIIFSVLNNCDDINWLNVLSQLHQFCAVYAEPLLFGHGVIQWKNLEFGVQQVQNLLRQLVDEICNVFLYKKTLRCDDIRRRLIAGLMCVYVIDFYSIPMDIKHLENICNILCLEDMPEEKMIDQLQKVKTTFQSSLPYRMHQHLTIFCQSCIDKNIDEWVWVLPVLHVFSPMPNQKFSHTTMMHNQEDIWARLEGLAYENVKTQRSIHQKIIAKKYLLKADPALIQSWLCLVPIDSMTTILKRFPVQIMDALKACFFKFHGADFGQRQGP